MLMTISASIIVCNQYFMQPLLPHVEISFNLKEAQAGLLTVVTQIRYALGMIFLILVADFVEKRRFICVILVLVIICLIGIFISPIYHVTLAICFLLGVTSVTPQLLILITAQLAKPAQRGKAVGTVVSGTVIGILASLVLAGFLGELGLHNDAWHFWTKHRQPESGWKTIFWVAAILIILTITLRVKLPQLPATADPKYGEVLKSLAQLFCENGTLPTAGACGFFAFGAFNIFWTPLADLFRDTYHRRYPSRDAGQLKLVGIISALAANLAGRLIDEVGPFLIISVAVIVIFVSFLGVTFICHWIAGRIVTCIVMDSGGQAWNTSIQTIVQGLSNVARSRVTAIAIFMLFCGDTAGSISSMLVYDKFHWQGVGFLGLGLIVIGGTIHFTFRLGINYSKEEFAQRPPFEAVAEMESTGTSAGSYTEGPTGQFFPPQANLYAPIRKPGFA
jgi:predicted MFS family arabinose efflux permease